MLLAALFARLTAASKPLLNLCLFLLLPQLSVALLLD
jgi:hypothetical protein